ncbi:MAG: M48 family metalloprotease [Gammaproteobacteria bacterium]|nr:M48 family metalloprotease [Gammaproteobacteria bacterium]
MFHRRRQSSHANLLARLTAALLLVLGGVVCAASSELPSLGENSTINIERETRLGRSVYERLRAVGLVESHPLLDRYINELGYRLLAGIDNRVRGYRFFIIRDDAVNAFALPGGFIGINRGLIRHANTQHQLASVMAHEIAHVELRHGLDMMEKGGEINTATILTMLAGLLLGSVDSQVGSAVMFGGAAAGQQAMVNFTRDNEYEADRIGIGLMADASFDTRGMVEFFTIMGNLSGSSGGIEYLSTHPLDNNRIAEATGRARNNPGSGDQVDDYLLFKDYLRYVSSDHLPIHGSPYLRALAWLKAADYERAEQMLSDLYHVNNENIWYSIAYAECLEHLGRESEAELVYRRLLDIFPGDYVLSVRLLRLLIASDRNQSALKIARRLEIEFPRETQIYFLLSEIYKSLQRPALQKMAEAEFHRLNGNPRQSIRLYNEVLKQADVDQATLSKAREKRQQLLN